MILVKAGLRLRGLDVGPVRLPLVDATEPEVSQLATISPPPGSEAPA